MKSEVKTNSSSPFSTFTRSSSMSKAGLTSVTKLCILIAILFHLYENSHSHSISPSPPTPKAIKVKPTVVTTSTSNINSSRRIISSLGQAKGRSSTLFERSIREEKKWKPLVQLPIKLVSLRHSRFYLLGFSSPSFTFYTREQPYDTPPNERNTRTTLDTNNRRLTRVDEYTSSNKNNYDGADDESTSTTTIPFHDIPYANNSLFHSRKENVAETFPKTDFFHYNNSDSNGFISQSNIDVYATTTSVPTLDTGQSIQGNVEVEVETDQETIKTWTILTDRNDGNESTSVENRDSTSPTTTTTTYEGIRKIISKINSNVPPDRIASPSQSLKSTSTIRYFNLTRSQRESERILSPTKPLYLLSQPKGIYSSNIISHSEPEAEVRTAKSIKNIVNVTRTDEMNLSVTRHKQRRRHGRSQSMTHLSSSSTTMHSPLSSTLSPPHLFITPFPLLSPHSYPHYHSKSSSVSLDKLPSSPSPHVAMDHFNRFNTTRNAHYYYDTEIDASKVFDFTLSQPMAQPQTSFLKISPVIRNEETSEDSTASGVMNYSTEDYFSDEEAKGKTNADNLGLSATAISNILDAWNNNVTLFSLTNQSSEGTATLPERNVGINKSNAGMSEDQTLGNSTKEIFTTTRIRNSSGVLSSTVIIPLEADERDELIREFEARHPVKIWKALGFYDDAYLQNINTHWLQFQPADPIVHKILAILYGILMAVGCGGNLLVIVMFFRCRSLRTPPNYLIVNLAVSDFFMMVKMPIFIFNSLYCGPALGAFGCKIYGFLGGLTGTASIMTLAAIALDRYYVIVFPLNPLKRTTSTRAILMISAVWLYSGLFSSLPLLGVNGYVSEGYLTSCSFDYLSTKMSDRIFVGVFFVAAWVFPLSIILYSYTRIFWMVQAAERLDFFHPKGDNNTSAPLSRESFKCTNNQKKKKTEIKIAVLSGIIVFVWGLAWTPYASIALAGIFGYKSLISPLVSSIPALFCKTASCIDPFLYAINHPRFQRELKNKVQFCYPVNKKSKRRQTSVEISCYSNASTFKENSDISNEGNISIQSRKASPQSLRRSPESLKMKSNAESATSATSSPASITFKLNLKESDLNKSSPLSGGKFTNISLKKLKSIHGVDKNAETDNPTTFSGSSGSSSSSSKSKSITIIDKNIKDSDLLKNVNSFTSPFSAETVVQGTSQKSRGGILVNNKKSLGHIFSENNLLKGKVSISEGGSKDNFCDGSNYACGDEVYRRTSSLGNFDDRDSHRESSADDYRRALRNPSDIGIFIKLKDKDDKNSNNFKISTNLGTSTRIFNGKTLNAGTLGRIKLETTIM